MVTKDEVLKALKNVMDPELGMDIVSAEMVRGISVEGASVSVVLALTSETCPLANKLRKSSEEAIRSLEGIGKVNVELTVMSEEELNRLVEKVRSKGKTPQLPEKLPKKGIKNILTVLSGKGGVGKSSVAAMLAVEFSRKGLKVGVLDADITGPSIPKIFGAIAPPLVKAGKIVPSASKGGIKIISMNLITGDQEAPIIWRGPLVSSAIRQFYVDVDWGELDYLIVDLPPGTSDAQLTVMQLLPVDGIVVVTSPQELAGMIVSKAANMSQRLNVPILGVIENMSYVKCPNCGEKINLFGDSRGRLLAEKIDTKFLGSLPIDPELSKACDEGRIEGYKSKDFQAIVNRILASL
ncbi:MAG: Mrp/NBP35 family ATP-binding protein [Candidatus Verstraetearchaeota archaeon]|nr:Mrp/NBP35 family ATP-binding protein [Candidatus Verstraetearchaeota archaeon]